MYLPVSAHIRTIFVLICAVFLEINKFGFGTVASVLRALVGFCTTLAVSRYRLVGYGYGTRALISSIFVKHSTENNNNIHTLFVDSASLHSSSVRGLHTWVQSRRLFLVGQLRSKVFYVCSFFITILVFVSPKNKHKP